MSRIGKKNSHKQYYLEGKKMRIIADENFFLNHKATAECSVNEISLKTGLCRNKY